ncbi:methyltransferase domain protein [Veillonella dispar ATCC 17748]|uniref:Methyltransferase domain protein n=1 Tax=Veillonella dispar ATCC 17748 TaxID=546273 RepID=C4FNM8_9FIRM|nr:class I SAM-dependent methyltransferase [Veillonella dispar]EEP66486.1 methyltransferase domain protein [Veillonella dispar ATCC 17748]MBS7066206.1 methyltransferase regulatory domain-containing protein [Veillonella dispar]VEG94044.1 tRNA (guanine-N(7)-)-methyltransferase [Veillonella dispar]
MAKDNQQITTDDMQQTIYKELGYKSYPFPFTTPAYLEAYGTLVGLNTPPAKTARVLELGATYGGNIISQAVHNPEATFVGIELSQDQVEKGNKIISDAKLDNVSLIQGDIMNFDETLGTFDYIIAHGFYSWISDEMKDKLLDIISNHLADNGIAYVSYNTYPGWHTMEEVRQLMLFANRDHDELTHKEKVLRGKTVGSLVGSQILNYDNLKERNSKFLGALRSVMQKDDYYVGHDHLEPHNDPCYFYQFNDHLKAHNLTYVCDADLTLSMVRTYDESIADKLEKLAPNSQADQEQYLDFMLDTTFRKSIICKERAAKDINYDVANPDKVNTVPVRTIVNSFVFQILFDEEALEMFENDLVRDTFKALIKDGGTFNMIEALAILKAAHDAAKASEDDLEPAVCSLYKAIVEHMVRGGIRFYKTFPDKQEYMEGLSYVPARFTNFVKAIADGGSEYIYGANMFNDAIGDISEEDLLFMELLNKPKAKSTLIKKIKDSLFSADKAQTGKHQNAMAEAFYNELTKRMEQLGFIRSKKTDGLS